uniref:Vomeronasal type-1 receptor n=1 Tax=Mastacembelus armatus TaxID=205130 RepID=A0A3Q3NHE5_9TELE
VSNKNLAIMGRRIIASPVQISFYFILLIMGILGNTTVVRVLGKSIFVDPTGTRNSDIIIFNMALSNLVVCLMRNTVLAISDLGLELSVSKLSCQFLMGVWVWLRSVNVWSTFFLSAFHLLTLRRVTPMFGNLQRGMSKPLLLSLGIIWFFNYICAIPAHIFSTKGGVNTTETLMLVSSTTRPVLSCVWNFSSTYSGLAYATTSMVIHEILPILLMIFTNICSIYTLYKHASRRSLVQDASVIKRIPAERRAAKVILMLITLFIASWGTSVISVTYFNYKRSSSSEFFLIITRFSNIIFIALSPAALAFGHRQLRSFIKSFLTY